MRTSIMILLSAALLLAGAAQSAGQAKSLHEPGFKPMLRVKVQNTALRVHSDGPNYLVTYPDGRLVADPALGRPAILAALIHRHWCNPTETAAFEKYKRQIKDFLKVEAAAQAVLAVRGAATQALVDMSLTYLTADPTRLTRDMVMRQLKSSAKGALQDSLTQIAKNPDAYLRLMAAKILSDASRDLGVMAGNCRIYRSAAIPVEELKRFDDQARRTYTRVVPAQGLMQALRPGADVLSQLKDVLGDVNSRLKEKVPGLNSVLSQGGEAVYSRIGGALDQIYQRYKPYRDYRTGLKAYESKAEKGRKQMADWAGQKFQTALTFGKGYQYLNRNDLPGGQASAAQSGEDQSGRTAAGIGAAGGLEAGGILDGKGYGSIKVGVSSQKDVQRILGSDFKDSRTRYIHRMIYEKKGIVFMSKPRDKRGVIIETEFRAPFAGVTRRGVKIGRSTMGDVVKAYGPADYYSVSKEWKFWNQYPGIVFEIDAVRTVKKYPMDVPLHLKQPIVAVRVRPIRRDDLFPRKGRLTGWKPSGRWSSGGHRFDDGGQRFKAPVSGTGFEASAGGETASFSVRIMQFENAAQADRLAPVYLKDEIARIKKRKNYLGALDLSGLLGRHSFGYRMKCAKRTVTEMFTVLDRYCIRMYEGCRSSPGNPAWAKSRYGELLKFMDAQIRFND